MSLIKRASKWWRDAGSTAPVPETETEAQKNYRRTFLKQVCGSVLVAGGATKVGRNILEMPVNGPTLGVSVLSISKEVSGFVSSCVLWTPPHARTNAFPDPDSLLYPPQKMGLRRLG